MGQVLPSRHTFRMWTASTQTVAQVRCVSAYSEFLIGRFAKTCTTG
jgi:hypothetical protein